jgi:hypothetical protein
MSTLFTDPDYLEAVYAALFAQLQTAQFAGDIEIQTFQRVVVVPEQIAVADQPALILVQGPMRAEQKDFSLTKWTMTALVAVYLQSQAALSPNSVQLSATQANYIVWGISNALNTNPLSKNPYEKQTLGGLVYHCWVEGDVETAIGESQIVVSIPIFMIAGPVG